MAEQEGRVAVYIDFDNIVISRYDQLNGNGAWRRDDARLVAPARAGGRDTVAAKLAAAEIDVGAILDYASSFGTVALSRAYADWSIPVNASYRRQLVNRAVDLTQLFPTTKAFKNGADIRLSVDVLEDLFRLPDLTHVVIVAGDSDYIALAQRCKRLGRFVLGIGVSGRTSPALIAACDHFEMYDAIPQGGDDADEATDEPAVAAAVRPAEIEVRSPTLPVFAAPVVPPSSMDRRDGGRNDDPEEEPVENSGPPVSARAATRLLVRALELLQAKDDEEWQDAAAVKAQIRRLDPAFSERTLGYRSFTDFAKSRNSLVEVRTEGQDRLIRLR
ncbi:NYN domain-containing protein [Naasia sp. SYSU D00948]|uniref:NYN domain-containing protein n=1 Tax=Naasia sp. SYSU D00948 TaxID=2817379 RepID=UPI001B30229A|nr:NYN domain-containing protein [Naasia sp. SYSU D00948]